MSAPKVRLYIRIRLTDGRSIYADPAWNKNRTIRAGYASLNNSQEPHPEGVYYLRYLRDGKRRWHAVGRNADAAIVALRKSEHDLQAISLGIAAPRIATVNADTSDKPDSISLDDAIDTYLAEVRRFRAPKTISACERMLTVFGSRLASKRIKDIVRKDLLDHMFFLKQQGLGDRTVYNHIMRIGTLLKANGVGGLLCAADKPRYDEKEVEAYSTDQLTALFAAAVPEELQLFEFFVGTGLREQEVMYTTWKNIDFQGKVVKVRSKPEMGFRIKDHEERSVPVPDSLIDSLLKRKRISTSMLVFPGPNGKPNGHFLRVLQNLAFRAGLNCGECVNKVGHRCATKPICGEWGLHKFRKTFATFHNEAGIPVSTLRLWLGHSDLSTSLRYLAAANLRSERTRTQVNSSFAMLSAGMPCDFG